ncbi:hypothetical protein [Kitasatospora sp. NPDC004531]
MSMNVYVLGDPMLLDYRISTYPDELTVDYPDPVDLILTVDKAPTAKKVHCDKITVSLLMGNGDIAWLEEKDFGAVGHSVKGGTEIGHGEGWKAVTKQVPRDGKGLFCDVIFTPRTTAVFDGTWTLQLRVKTIKLNKKPGHAELLVTEQTAETGTTSEKTVSATVQKAPREFELHSFRADPMQIQNGGLATLKWQGTRSATYTMFWNDSRAEITPGPDTPPGQWTCPDPLVKDTNFLLQGHFAQGNNTYERTLTTLVVVLTPDLVVNKLTVKGPLQAMNTVTVEGTTDLVGAVTAKSTLTAKGALVAKSTATVEGKLEAKQSATVDGKLEAKQAATIDGHLLARTTATIDGLLEAKQAAKVGATLDVTGKATFSTVQAKTVKVV